MRKIISILIVVLVIAGIAPFVLPLKDGEPLLHWQDISMPSLPSVPNLPREVTGALSSVKNALSGDSPQAVTVYKWKDSMGNWHYGERPPEGLAYEDISVDPNANVIQSPRASDSMQGTSAVSVRRSTTESLSSTSLISSPARMSETMNDARGIETMLQQRKAQQDKRLQGIQ